MNKTLQNFDSNGGIPLQYDVFICHCSTDKKVVVDPLVKACTDAGINCWVDSKEIQWGDSISMRINEGLLKSRFVLVVISESTSSRTWQPREIAAAIDAENKQGSVRVLPLYVGDRAELEKQWPLLADKHSLIWDNNSPEIVQAIQSKLGHSQPVTSAVPKFEPHIPSLPAPITDVDRESYEHSEQIAIALKVKVDNIEEPIPTAKESTDQKSAARQETNLTASAVIDAATTRLRQSVDPIEVKRRHREAKNAILDYAKNVIQSDGIALNALADFLGTAQNASIVVARLFWDGESDQNENSTSNRNQSEIPKPIEMLLDFARKRRSDLQQMVPATILAIRNVAICFSFPHEMQKKALEQCIANNPIPAPDHDTKWSMIFICSVLGTIDRMSHKTNDNNGRIRHRLLNGGESMIDIHVNQLFPATSLPMSPPRESGADSVRFLTDMCLGLARELDLNSDESEILNFFQQWTGGTFPPTCDSIERLKAEFRVWKTLHAELLLLIPEHRTHSELRKIRTLFPAVQLVSVPSKEASEIGTLKIYIRSFDDMANPKDLNSR